MEYDRMLGGAIVCQSNKQAGSASKQAAQASQDQTASLRFAITTMLRKQGLRRLRVLPVEGAAIWGLEKNPSFPVRLSQPG